MTDSNLEEEWTPPDKATLRDITKAVANEVAHGEEKKEIANWLVADEGWPEKAAIGFVNRVAQERDFHPPEAGTMRSLLLVAGVVILGIAAAIVMISGVVFFSMANSDSCEKEMIDCGPGEAVGYVLMLVGIPLVTGTYMLWQYGKSR